MGLFDDMFQGPPQETEKGTGPLRPAFVKRAAINVEKWFDVPALWTYVKEKTKGYSIGDEKIEVVQITYPGADEATAAYETGVFFDIADRVGGLDARMAWERVLIPFLDDLEEIMNKAKPADIKGRLRFDIKDGVLWLFYIEK